MRGFNMKTNIIYNDKKLEILDTLNPGKVLIFMEYKYLNQYNKQIYPALRNREIKIIYVSEKQYPTLNNIEQSVLLTIKFEPKIIITLGDFSLINYTKLINYYVINTYQSMNKLNQKPTHIHIPVPTAGGFEITKTAFMVDKNSKTLQWISSDHLIPDILILSPSMASTIDKEKIKYMVLMAICSNIDAYISTMADDFSTLYSNRSLKIMNRSILLLNELDYSLLLNQIQLGSVMSGLALNQSSIGLSWLISLYLYKYFDGDLYQYFPILMPEIINFNIKNNMIKAQYAKLARKINFHYNHDELNAQAFVENFKSIRKSLHLPQKLHEIGIDYGDLIASMDDLANDIYKSQDISYNPIPMTLKDIRELLLLVA
ncbi:MAG: iron-containing alcohol dehydrogenase [Tissierellia bacterium]|nr:iron-containing alcohol dehydrogenase [Tissierellia bacterium]